MTLRVSTGLRNQMMTQGSFKSIMEAANNCRLRIYSGTAPASADEAVPAGSQLLVEIFGGDALGLRFDTAASGGVLGKEDGQSWEGTVAIAGEASFYRLIADGDSGGQSTSEPRLQGDIGQAGEDLNLSSLNLVDGAAQVIDYFVVNFPTP